MGTWQGRRHRRGREVDARAPYESAHLLGNLGDARVGLRRKWSQKNRNSRLCNARLLVGNRGKRVAEQRLVVERDAGDRAGDGMTNAGGVESTAKSSLEHSHVDFRFGEGEKSQNGCNFEIG